MSRTAWRAGRTRPERREYVTGKEPLTERGHGGQRQRSERPCQRRAGELRTVATEPSSRQLVAEKQFWNWTGTRWRRGDRCQSPTAIFSRPRPAGQFVYPSEGRPVRSLAVVPAAGAALPAVEETVVYADTAGMEVTSWLHHRGVGLRAGQFGSLMIVKSRHGRSSGHGRSGLENGRRRPLSRRSPSSRRHPAPA